MVNRRFKVSYPSWRGEFVRQAATPQLVARQFALEYKKETGHLPSATAVLVTEGDETHRFFIAVLPGKNESRFDVVELRR